MTFVPHEEVTAAKLNAIVAAANGGMDYAADIAFAVRDTNGRAPLAINRAGRITGESGRAFALSSDSLTKSRRDLFICGGDSLTEGGSPGDSYPTVLDTLVSGTVVNLGVSGWQSADIAAHLGGVVVTVAAGTIPTSGAVTLPPTFTPMVGKHRGTDTGTLAGVPGTFAYDTGEFTRTTGGAPVAVADGTRFIPTALASADPAATFILWPGQNDLAFGWPYTDTAPGDAIASIVAAMTRDIPRIVVLGVHTGAATWLDDVQRQNAYTRRLLSRIDAASVFIDVQELCVTQGLALAGITPTGPDIDAIAVGLVPPSLLYDGTHFNAAAKRYVIAPTVAAVLSVRDWS